MKIIIDGQIKEVRAGYGRNFLIPQGKALLATGQAIKELEEKKKKLETKIAKLSKKFKNLKITIKAKAGESDKLFGAITSKDIQEKLEESKIKIARKAIQLDKPIKKIGEYKIVINLGEGQKQSFSLSVAR